MDLLDWGVIGIYVLAMVAIGAYYGRKNESGEDFVLGGRSMSPIAVGLSLFATLASSLSYLSIPGEIVGYGPMFLGQTLAYPFVYLIVGFGIIPLLMRQSATSAYELLEGRLGVSVRMAAAGVFILLRLSWMATILYATSSTVLVPMWGLGPEATPWLSLALGAITVAYAATGGLRAVVMTDALQAITMFAGAIVTIVVVSIRMGGIDAWWPHQWPQHWPANEWGFDPHARLSFGTLLMSTILWYVCTNGSDHMAIQRYFATPDTRTARKTLLVSLCSDVTIAILLALTGLALLGYYQINAAELGPGRSLQATADQIFPTFIMSSLPGGLAGLVIAAILAAAMSSLSSGINATCAVFGEDFIARWQQKRLEGKAAVTQMRWLSCIIGAIAVGASILNSFITGNLIERCFKVVNLFTAPLFTLFFLALFVPWSNSFGAWCGLIGSIATAIAVAYSAELGLGPGMGIAWIVPSSLVAGVIIGVVASGVARLAPWRKPPVT